MNDQIRRNPIRLIDEQEQMVGVVDTGEALDRARELGLDLVEVAPDADPPVCRILDYGKFRYEQSKKERANKKNSKTAELKSIRLGRSLKIGQNDIEIRIRQTQKFLLLGHKVQIVQRFRGREVTLTDKGMERLADIADRLAPLSKVEAPPRRNGRELAMVLAPDKVKIEKWKAENAELAKAAEEAPEVEEDLNDVEEDESIDSE